MSPKIVFMFSGQGSQYYHMGNDLFENNPFFREQMLSLDKLVHRIIGESIIDQIYSKQKKKSDPFNRTLYTHPAIFMIEYVLTNTLIDKGIIPDYVLGASLGEFSSAACAGIMALEDIVDIILKQARSLESCPEGGMLAILEKPSLFYNKPLLYENSEMAAINFDSHFVISGRADNLNSIKSFLKRSNINYQILPVTQAFHSSLIESAAHFFIPCLAQKNYTVPKMKFISSVHGREEVLPAGIYFWDVVRKPIMFQEAIHTLEECGSYIYIDLGPSGTLATFVKYNLSKDSDSKIFSIMTPFGNDLKNLQNLNDFLI